jgi:hypothetical protein
MKKQQISEKGIRSAFKISPEREKEILKTPPEMMIRPEAIIYTRIGERAFRNAVARGLIPEIRIGRRRMYRRDALIDALMKLETGVIA